MCGYGVIAVSPRDEQTERFRCCSCRLILRAPVQVIATGKLFCRECIPDGLGVTEYRLDKAIEKEIFGLQVYCSNKVRGCQWQGKMRSFLQEHSEECQCQPKDQHEIQRLREINSKLQDEKDCLKQLLSLKHGSPASYYPFHNLSEGDRTIQDKLELPAAENIQTKLIIDGSSEPEITKPLSSHHELPSLGSSIDFNELAAQCEEDLLDLSKKDEQLKTNIDRFEGDIQQFANGMSAYARLNAYGSELDDVTSYEDRYTKCKIFNTAGDEFSVFLKPPNESNMQCRWRIKDVAERASYACSHRDEPLISPPWLTSCCGYRMRALVYLNGFNHSWGTHMSVFMSVVCGPDDDFLRWPAHGNPTFCLLDHEKNVRPILRTFHSDPFIRPSLLTELSIASGCIKFVPLATLCKERYVKDNTMVLEFRF